MDGNDLYMIGGSVNIAALLRGKFNENDEAHEASAARRCDFGVGCGEHGRCYAKEHGRPEMCGRMTESE
jgi:hypothetical protein